MLSLVFAELCDVLQHHSKVLTAIQNLNTVLRVFLKPIYKNIFPLFTIEHKQVFNLIFPIMLEVYSMIVIIIFK